MNVTRFLRQLRVALGDKPDATAQRTWSDAELVDIAYQVVASLFRDRVTANENYHNLQLLLPKTSSRQIHANLHEYPLPSWLYTVTAVRASSLATDSIGRDIERWEEGFAPASQSYRISSTRSLQLAISAAIDIELECTKIPARLVRGVIDVDAKAYNDILLPLTPEFEHETEPGMYRNAVIQVTSATGAASKANIGEQRVVTETAWDTIGANRYIRLFFNRPWLEGIKIGQGFESVIEIEDAHTRLLILASVVDSALATDNVAAIAAVRDELKVEREKFESMLKPRDDTGPQHFTVVRDDQWARFDPDRDSYFGS